MLCSMVECNESAVVIVRDTGTGLVGARGGGGRPCLMCRAQTWSAAGVCGCNECVGSTRRGVATLLYVSRVREYVHQVVSPSALLPIQ